MRRILPLILAVCSSHILAQEPVIQGPASHSGHSVTVYGGVGVSSARISNQFVSSLLFDETLDQSALDNQLNRLRTSNNRVGGDYEVGVYGAYRIKNSSMRVLLNASDAGYAEVSLPKNAVDLAFRGNAPFAGDTLFVSELNGYALRYQKMSLGLSYQSKMGTSYWATANFLNGEQFAELNLRRANLYTSQLGDTMDLDVYGYGRLSDTGNVGFTSPNGAGFVLDFGLSQEFEGDRSNWRFSGVVRNIGKMYWSKKTISAQYDTSVTWTGIEVGDLTNINEQFEGNELSDSLASDIQNGLGKEAYSHWLPGSMQLDFIQLKEEGLEVGGGAVARWSSLYRPYVYGRVGYRFNKMLAVHSSLGYGGFGGVQIGVRAGFVSEHMAINAAVNNLEALMIPVRFAGVGAGLNFSYLF